MSPKKKRLEKRRAQRAQKRTMRREIEASNRAFLEAFKGGFGVHIFGEPLEFSQVQHVLTNVRPCHCLAHRLLARLHYGGKKAVRARKRLRRIDDQLLELHPRGVLEEMAAS